MTYAAILLDIEGTVCPISFVKEVLFPFFLKQVDALCSSQDPQVQRLLSQFEVEDVSGHIRGLVERDVKDQILKQLQGIVWENGYKDGQIKAPVYGDAIKFIKNSRVPVFIYSSGSVKAQKLLFQYVEFSDGTLDLRPLIKGYFDINTSGVKTQSDSYTKIAQDVVIKPHDMLFISDNPLELDAANSAGMQTMLAVRPGNSEVEDASKYNPITNFDQL
ncbi:LAQU0S03e01816g1_1 [Lachancea quebecensis]|uniref:Enolase-phosphatase E1 n=1 Tax=Lachancea quebecensis TaxID=1654605 RepID=A0A0N7ML63_9SACH|nr:LAQU0S03e01816g1_1 [Lachancea quebecensis]